MAKKSAAVQTSISVPGDMKKRMQKHRDINWSAVAVKAFEAELNAIAQRKKGLDMESVRERLLASKAASESESYQQGHEWGIEWAKESAEYSELKRLAAVWDRCATESCSFDDHFAENSGITFDHLGLSGWVAASILSPELTDEADDILWEPAFGADYEEYLEDNEMLRGFCYGAIEVFNEASV